MALDLQAFLEQQLTSPSHVMVDGQQVTARSVGDIIKAYEFLIGLDDQESVNKAGMGLRIQKMVPPGTG